MMPSVLLLATSLPAMVYVLPEPVCPYANTVALKPSRAESSSALTPDSLKHCACEQRWSRQPSSANFLAVCRTLPLKSSSDGSSTCTSALSAPMRITSSSPA